MDVTLTQVAGSAMFLQSPARYLLLDRQMRIVGVNPAFVRTIGRSVAELTGMNVFAAFPDNPADPRADGVAQLSASLERVLRSGQAHDMLVQRYDIPLGRPGAAFTERVWSPVNSPIADQAGRTAGVLHHAEDITELRHLAGWATDPAIAPLLRSRLRQVASIAAHARVEQERGSRVTDALIRVVASRGLTGRTAAQSRREQLWRQIVEHSQGPGWLGWAQAVCGAAVREIPGVHGATLSVHAAGVHEVLGTSGRWATYLDELHLSVGQGPALTALDTHLPVLVADLATQGERWLGYTELAATHGLAAVHAFPVQVHGTPVAALTVFGREPGALTTAGVVDAALLADLAGAVVTHDLDDTFAELLDETAPPGPYADIAMATGMISVRYRLSVDDALARMRATAYTRGLALAALATGIISGQATLD